MGCLRREMPNHTRESFQWANERRPLARHAVQNLSRFRQTEWLKPDSFGRKKKQNDVASMKIESLRSFEGVAFGSSATALEARGKPEEQKVNARGETEYRFPEIVFRFAADKLVEVSFQIPEKLEINGESVSAGELLGFMRDRDSEFFEACGFGVAPRLGLAYDLEHESAWITAFVEGRWDVLRAAN